VAAPVDESRAVDVTLAAGEMSLHHLNLIHASSPSHSPDERIGFAIRYTVPGVRQALPHHAVVLARGRDESGCFELLRQPPGDDLEQGLAAQQEFLARQRRVRLPGRGGHG
jgi:ectoine hydroxylase-related dioxygenase (phytanoyl-CoA dioxygenase family)